MNQRTIRSLLGVTVVLVITSCAAGGFVPQTPSMPAARAALRPEYRLFYDALQDYGDWVLIEPFGFVFRPKVDFATFRPYDDGFWAPSDPWGWVWISAEPFGWATYHYGNWIWDRFQGWVWLPGMDWGPAWVSWELSDRYAGWAPLWPQSGGGYYDAIPGGAYLYAPLERLGATDLRAHLATREQLGDAVAGAKPIMNLVERDGLRFNFGPSFARVERARGGPLPRVKIESAAAGTLTPAPRDVTSGEAATSEVEAVRQAATSAARQAHSLIEHGGAPPARLPLPRPLVIKAPDDRPRAGKPPRRSPRGSAAPDTTQ